MDRPEDRVNSGKLALVIPAYRPGGELAEVVSGVLGTANGDSPIGSVVIVDDGSGPAFADVFRAVEADRRVTVVRHAVNLGKGAALKTGFNYAMVTWPELGGIVSADADGQHLPGDILKVAKVLASNSTRVVLGVRRFDGDVPRRSRFGNRVTRLVFRALTGRDLYDTQTGLRGWPREHCEDCLRIAVNGYDFELECLLRAYADRRQSGSVLEVPIQTVYIARGRGSHFNPLLDSMRIYFVFLRYCGSSALAALLDSLTFYLAFSSSGQLVASQAAGRAVAGSVAFLLARHVVFKADVSVAVALSRYVALLAVMGVVSYSLIQLLHTRLGVPVIPAKLLAESVLFLGNFAIQRDFVFVRK